MDKNDILNYVTETPGNTNRAVLGSMLDSVAGGGGGGGGSSAFVVKFTWDIPTGTYSCDKTVSEIYDAAITNKQAVIGLTVNTSGIIDVMPLMSVSANKDFVDFATCYYEISNDTINRLVVSQLELNADGTVNYDYGEKEF